MSTSTQHFSDAPQAQERRLHPRIFPKSLIYVACGQANGGMVLNAGEDGLAVSMAIAVGDEAYSCLNVRMNGLAQPIELQGRMVWTTRSKKRAGVQLLDISEQQRGQIREWLKLDGIRDINLAPRESDKSVAPPVAVPVAAVSSIGLHEPVLTAPALEQAHFIEPKIVEPRFVEPKMGHPRFAEPQTAEPRFVEPSSLLEVFGGTAPESLGPAVAESFPAAGTSTVSLPSQSFDTVNPSGFRDNEWDLASVTMVPRRKPQSQGLSAIALILLWIAIPAFGIGVLAGRRPLERWLSGAETTARRTTAEVQPSTKSVSLQEEPVFEPNEEIIEDSGDGVPAPSFVEPPVASKPAEIGPTESSEARESRLLNSMSTEEKRALKNGKPLLPAVTLGADPSQPGSEPHAPVLSSSANFGSPNPSSVSPIAPPKDSAATEPAPTVLTSSSTNYAARRAASQPTGDVNFDANRNSSNVQKRAETVASSVSPQVHQPVSLPRADSRASQYEAKNAAAIAPQGSPTPISAAPSRSSNPQPPAANATTPSTLSPSNSTPAPALKNSPTNAGTGASSSANSSSAPPAPHSPAYTSPNSTNQSSVATSAGSPTPRVALPSPTADHTVAAAVQTQNYRNTSAGNYNSDAPGNYNNAASRNLGARSDASRNYGNPSAAAGNSSSHEQRNYDNGAPGNYTDRGVAQAASRNSSTLSASNIGATPSSRSPGAVGVSSSPRALPSGYVPSLAPVKAAPPLRGVMLIARKNDDAFMLRLPEESIPDSNRSAAMRMQRFVLMPQQSRWHRHGAIAKVSIGDLLIHAAPDKPDARIQPRTGESVTVRAYVDKNGNVGDLKPVSGRYALMPRVLRALRGWQFDQTLVDGKPVESEVNVTVDFRPES